MLAPKVGGRIRKRVLWWQYAVYKEGRRTVNTYPPLAIFQLTYTLRGTTSYPCFTP